MAILEGTRAEVPVRSVIITCDRSYPELIDECWAAKLPSGRVGEYAYPRYFFSNLSADIRGLFCEYCDRLGIRWTQSNHRNISVSHRSSVAAMDEFIGPKR
jgi:hypothetical protein